MQRIALVDHRTNGDLVLARLTALGVPKELAPHFKQFDSAHSAFTKAADEADEARSARDQAIAALGEADVALDATIDPLADRMIGAGLGTRRAPFGDAYKLAPSKLKALPYKDEVAAVRELVTNVRKKKPSTAVKECLDATENAAKVSDKALQALTAPQAAFDRARGARDALLPEWSRSFTKLRVHAKAHWHDEPEIYASVFAPPEKVQRPTKKRAKPAGKKGSGEGSAPSGGDGGGDR